MGPLYRYRLHFMISAEEFERPTSYRTDVILGADNFALARKQGEERLKAIEGLTNLQTLGLTIERIQL